MQLYSYDDIRKRKINNIKLRIEFLNKLWQYATSSNKSHHPIFLREIDCLGSCRVDNQLSIFNCCQYKLLVLFTY